MTAKPTLTETPDPDLDDALMEALRPRLRRAIEIGMELVEIAEARRAELGSSGRKAKRSQENTAP